MFAVANGGIFTNRKSRRKPNPSQVLETLVDIVYMDRIYYKSGYKYQLHVADYAPNTIYIGGRKWLRHTLLHKVLDDPAYVERDFYAIDGGNLYIRHGYAWDGASGPAIDTVDTQRASLIHDVLWQAIEEGVIPEQYRPLTNLEFRDILFEDIAATPSGGLLGGAKDAARRARARLWYHAVDKVGSKWVKAFKGKSAVISAP
jgi:hypothetical protein